MKPSKIIAQNVKRLREAQNITQQQLADRGGVPRSTIATLESGESNPNIDSLIKLAEALAVTLDELVTKSRPKTILIRAKDVPKKIKSSGAVIQQKVLPDPIYGVELDYLQLKSGARMRGVPHTRGTREYFSCMKGEVEIYCDGEKFALKAGDVLAFQGDLPHSYYNSGRGLAEGFSIIVLAKSKSQRGQSLS